MGCEVTWFWWNLTRRRGACTCPACVGLQGGAPGPAVPCCLLPPACGTGWRHEATHPAANLQPRQAVCRIVSTFGVAASSVLAVLLEGVAGEAGGAAGVPVPPVLTVHWACCFIGQPAAACGAVAKLQVACAVDLGWNRSGEPSFLKNPLLVGQPRGDGACCTAGQRQLCACLEGPVGERS